MSAWAGKRFAWLIRTGWHTQEYTGVLVSVHVCVCAYTCVIYVWRVSVSACYTRWCVCVAPEFEAEDAAAVIAHQQQRLQSERARGQNGRRWREGGREEQTRHTNEQIVSVEQRLGTHARTHARTRGCVHARAHVCTQSTLQLPLFTLCVCICVYACVYVRVT
eukprot:71561-Rhodomonas_salina.4